MNTNTPMNDLDHMETRAKFEELCGYKCKYICYKHKTKMPLHSFADKSIEEEAFTKQEVLRSASFGIRCGLKVEYEKGKFGTLICVDCDYKKGNDGESDLPVEFQNTYTDETGGGKHYFYIVREDLPTYWKHGTKKTKYKFDLIINPNVAVAMTNSLGAEGKYYNNIKYMPPQIIPQELYNLIDEGEQKHKHVKKVERATGKIIERGAKTNEFVIVEHLINLLPQKYFKQTELWNKVGWIIHYETNASQEGFDLFVKKSLEVEEYKNTEEQVYINFWNNANKSNSKQLTLASVYDWLKKEGIEEDKLFLKGTRNYIKYLVNEVCKTPNNLNIAKLAVALGEHNYYYYKEDDRILAWNGVYWSYEKAEKSNASLQALIFKKCIACLNKKYKSIANILATIIDEKEREKYQNFLQKIQELIDKCGNTGYIEASVKLIISLLKQEYVCKEINMADDYFVWENAVYSLKEHKFVPAEEYKFLFNTLHCPHKYREPTQKELTILGGIVKQICYNDYEFLEEFLKFYSTALSGECVNKFVQLVGGGRNGKGLWNSLMLCLLGTDKFTGYAYSFDVGIMCGRVPTGGSPELATMGNKRFLRTSEPSQSDGLINNSFMKKLTGGDAINGRMLYCSKVEHRNNSTTCLECNTEDQIKLSGNGKDEATKERVLVYPMLAHFSSNCDECKCKSRKKGWCFPKNKEYVSKEFQLQHVYGLFKILTESYKKYLEDNKELKIVGEMKRYTEEYLNGCDGMREAFNEYYYIVENEEDYNYQEEITYKDIRDKIMESDYWRSLKYAEKRSKNKIKVWKKLFEEYGCIIDENPPSNGRMYLNVKEVE